MVSSASSSKRKGGMYLNARELHNINIEEFQRGAEYRKTIKRRGNVKNIIYHPSGRICFLVTDRDLIVRTGWQTFLLRPIEVPGNLWQRRLNKIQELVLLRRIRNIDSLFAECGEGIDFIPTTLGRHV